MADETDSTPDIVDTSGSPRPSQQQAPPSTEQEGSLEDILATTSRDLIQTFAASISQSATREASESEEVRQELKRRLFRVIIRTYVWSTARFAHETETAEGQLARDVQGLLSAERDQGRSSYRTPTMMERLRVRLGELMAAVSNALAMFG